MKIVHMNAAVLFAMGILAGSAGAQEYPSKAVRMVVPFAAGGPNDVLGRVVAQKMSELLGQQIVIDNRAGGGGSTGTALVAVAPPDGYTLLFSGTSSLAVNPSLYKSLPYDPIKDFAPVGLAGTAPSLLVTHPSLPVKNLKELIALAKTHPGKLNFGSGGVGGTPHLAGELLKSLADIRIVHVPYRGAAPALTALTAGEVELYIGGVASVLPVVKRERARPLAVTSAKRTSLLPDIPTFIEAGIAGYELENWYAIVAPAATPKAIVARLNGALEKAMGSADVRKRFGDLGTNAVASTPERLGEYHRQELVKWAKVIKAAGIKPE